MRKLFRFLAATISVFTLAGLGTALYYEQTLADQYYIRQGETFTVGSSITATAVPASNAVPVSQTDQGQLVQLSLFGLIPIKQTRVSEVEMAEVIPGGTPFGIKLLTDGVLVVGLNNIDTNNGLTNPAKEAGLRVGDVITAINGQKVTSNKEIQSFVNSCGSDGLAVTYQRDGQTGDTTVHPVISRVDGKQKVGLWVRDSSAGIGTVTFYDPANQTFGGLGHGVTDVDTGEILPLSYGEVVGATITGYNKGVTGLPGQLQGSFNTISPIGSILLNTECGVYGEWYGDTTDTQPVKIALKQEVHTGPATILTTLSGSEPKEYQINIEQVDPNEQTATKNMVIRVTDEQLLADTGGILQGMSGSPILQDGKLVGAVTHVFVNDPTKGFGIFAENMYQTMMQMDTVSTSDLDLAS